MANDVTLPTTAGSSQGSLLPVVATEQIGGRHHQLLKVEFGAAGTATEVTGTSPLPTTSKTALTASAPTSATVGVASAQALAANANRQGLALVNTSVNRISIGIGQAAVLDSGITLMPSGGTWEMDEWTFATGAIHAIASAAGSNLAIQEWTA